MYMHACKKIEVTLILRALAQNIRGQKDWAPSKTATILVWGNSLLGKTSLFGEAHISDGILVFSVSPFSRWLNDSSECSFAKRAQREPFSSPVLLCQRLEDSGPEVFRTKFPEAYHTWGTRISRFVGISSNCRHSRWRPPHCHCTPSKRSSNIKGLCTLWLWRW